MDNKQNFRDALIFFTDHTNSRRADVISGNEKLVVGNGTDFKIKS